MGYTAQRSKSISPFRRAVIMRISILLMLLPLWPVLAWAQNPAIAEQRQAFKPILAAAEQGNLHEHAQTLASLRSYALYDYLTAADLRWRLKHGADSALDKQVQAFIGQHPKLPPAQSLRRSWIYSLAQRDKWPQVQRLTAKADDTSMQCLNLRARIASGQDKGAAKKAVSLWLVGKSQPNACDEVFEWMQDRGLLTPARIQQRARLAVINGQSGLARYLARKLDGPSADTVQRWVALLGSPVDIQFVPALDPDVAVAVFKRMALQDVDAAADLQADLSKRLHLGPAQVYEMRRYLGLLYAQKHRPEALAWFERLDTTRMDDYSRAWRIRAALMQGRWALALDWLNALPPVEAREEVWRYFRGRCLHETGRKDEARAVFAQLAQLRSYYGYLAADQLGRKYSFNSQPLSANAALVGQLRTNPALARAHELHRLNMITAANREWNVVTDGLSQPALQQAAMLAHQWGWHAQAIITLAKSDYWDDLDIRYPVVYQSLVLEGARDNHLDPAYVMAIIRTESLFRADVHSPANAVGLMQLLPGTARKVAREMGLSRPGIDDLEQPATNIPLGTHYLREQLDRFDDNLALASAAYNAGPHRVSRWLGETERAVDADIWVENIPYTETRNYVQRAMSHMTVFQSRLERKITRVTDRISPITPDSEVQP